MFQNFKIIRTHQLFVPAMLVPTAIMLIFSLFSLTAPLDSVKVSAAFKLGIVNEDTGLTFPPLKVSTRMLEGMGQNLPFQLVELDTKEHATTALDRGDVAAVLIFPPKFSKLAATGENIELEILNGNHLTLLETQLSTQLPMVMQANFSAAVLMLRDALGKGQLPNGTFPVTAKVTTLHKAKNAATLVAPFVMTFTTWLASFVGAMMLYLASKETTRGSGKAFIRTALPVIVTGLASATLALIVATTTGDFGLMLSVWVTVWMASVAVTWLVGGLFATGGMAALVLVIPAVFYQTAIGGAQAPLAAAPDWLQNVSKLLPFDQLGAMYRATVFGGGADIPYDLLAITAATGLVLIWIGSMLRGPVRDN